MKFQDGHQRQGNYAKQSNLTHLRKLINAKIKIRFIYAKLQHFSFHRNSSLTLNIKEVGEKTREMSHLIDNNKF